MKYFIPFILMTSCSGMLESMPKVAQAASLVCDSLETYEHFNSQISSVKALLDNGNYSGALALAKDLYIQYQNYPETEGLDELRSLITLIENLV